MTSLFLAQSDTTAGFLSKDKKSILDAKNSNPNKAILLESSEIETIKEHSRIPKILNKSIRRQNKTTFIFPNTKSFRVIQESLHLEFLKNFKIMYSSSANLSNKAFDYSFAFEKADVIVFDKRGIYESKSSNIFQIKKNKLRKIR